MQVLLDTKKEYIEHLLDTFTTPLAKKIYKLYNDVNMNISLFQKELVNIKNWNNNKIKDEYNELIKKTNCKYLDKLLEKIVVIDVKLKIDTSKIKLTKEDLDIIKGYDFIHKCLINISIYCWKNVYLFATKNLKPSEKQYHLNVIEKNIRKIVKNTIRDIIPFEKILELTEIQEKPKKEKAIQKQESDEEEDEEEEDDEEEDEEEDDEEEDEEEDDEEEEEEEDDEEEEEEEDDEEEEEEDYEEEDENEHKENELIDILDTEKPNEKLREVIIERLNEKPKKKEPKEKERKEEEPKEEEPKEEEPKEEEPKEEEPKEEEPKEEERNEEEPKETELLSSDEDNDFIDPTNFKGISKKKKPADIISDNETSSESSDNFSNDDDIDENVKIIKINKY